MKLSNDIPLFSEIEKNIHRNEQTNNDNKKALSDLEYFTNKKFLEVESKIFNLMNNDNDVKKPSEKIESIIQPEIPNNNNTNLNTNTNTNLSALNLDHINKINKDIENLKKLNRDFNEKIDRVSNQSLKSENIINEITIKIEEFTKANNLINAIKKETEENNKLLNQMENQVCKCEIKNNKNEEFINNLSDQILKLQDLNKTINIINNNKLNKDEYEKVQKGVLNELEKINKKFSETEKALDTKLITIEKSITHLNENNNNNISNNNKNKANNSLNGENEIFNNGKIEKKFEKIFVKLIVDQIDIKKTEILNLENEFFLSFLKKYNLNSINLFELEKNIKKITEEKIKENKEYQEFKEYANEQINFLEKFHQKLKTDFTRRFEKLESIDDDFQKEFSLFSSELDKEAHQVFTLQDMLKLAIENLRKNNLRIDTLYHKQDNLQGDILLKVKENLNKESEKILEEFKIDLKNSINLIDNKLREKADKMSLTEFGKKVDTKLANEFMKKLDKTDLKKNNNIINKKIDSLENKISKTLVDTLIDLQMDDAPLITKKTVAGEKCASCNQVKNNNNTGGMNTFNNTNGFNGFNPLNTNSYFNKDNYLANNNANNNPSNNIDDFANRTHGQGKFKVRNIQDNSNKFGTGSYSRYLNNVDNMNEELNTANANANANTNSAIKYASKLLPGISTKNPLSNTNANVTNNKKQFIFSNNVNVNANNNSNSNSNSNAYMNNTSGNIERKNFNKIKLDDLAEREYNDMINEELEKKILQPDTLIKNSNKIYENAEKRINNKSNK